MEIRSHSGQSLIEISIGVGIFAMLAAAIITLSIGSYQANFKSAQETKASHLAREGLEAARAIRDYNWVNLADGSYGLTNTNGYWEFQGTSQTIGPYTREIIIEPITRQVDLCGLPEGPDVVDPDAKKVTSKITWETIPARPRTLELVSYLSNWVSPSQTRCIECELYEITSTMSYSQDTVLDWSGKDVVIKKGGQIKADSTSAGPLTLTITTNCSLTIEEGGKITADGSSGSEAQREGGTINLQAPDITINGRVSANSESSWSPQGGEINIDATNLNLNSSGKILSEAKTLSSNDGFAGTINIQAANYDHQGRISVNVDGVQGQNEQLYAGTVTITGSEFTNKGKITADTYGYNGHGGNININTQNTSSNTNTTVYANCWLLWEGQRTAGQGGTIFIKANQLDIKNSKVEAIDSGSNPGTINLEYCQKDFTGTTFNPTPGETIVCP